MKIDIADILDREYRSIYTKIYNKELQKLQKSDEKLPHDLKTSIGLDKIKISVPEKAIKKAPFDIYKKNVISDHLINVFITKTTGVTWYCHLEVNLPKVLWGDNINNISSKDDYDMALDKLHQHLKTYGINIELADCYLNMAEFNRYLMLGNPFADYEEAMEEAKKSIVKGHFRNATAKHEELQNLTTFKIGTKNKNLKLYDKSLEVFLKKYQDEDFLNKLTKADLREMTRKYKSMIRAEITLKKDALYRFIPKETTLGELSGVIESITEEVFHSVIIETGLEEKHLENKKKQRARTQAAALRQSRRQNERGFLIKYLKDNITSIWGLQECLDAVDIVAETQNDKKNWKHRLREYYEPIKKKPEYIKNIEEITAKLGL